MARRKVKRPAPLKPHHKKGVVIVCIPKGTPPAEATKATQWARNMAAKISKSHERDHWNGSSWFDQ